MPDKKQQKILAESLEKLIQYIPVQQITRFTWFLEQKIGVNPFVLIPRPETEEMVLKFLKFNSLKKPKIMDIGTGSGCIAIALKSKIPGSEIYGIDISEKALSTARKNALQNQVRIRFFKEDIFNLQNRKLAKNSFDFIISNPPYIRDSERKHMRKNVIMYEPPEALFVPDNNPLKFYEAIAEAGISYLKQKGMLFLEINENLGNQTAKLFREKGYSESKVLKDMNGKDRFLIAFYTVESRQIYGEYQRQETTQ